MTISKRFPDLQTRFDEHVAKNLADECRRIEQRRAERVREQHRATEPPEAQLWPAKPPHR